MGLSVPPDLFEAVESAATFEGIVERLENAISAGLLAPGTRLPPERELAPRLGVSRWTLRKAISTLVQTGHLESRKGRTGGNFVAASPPLRRGGGGLPADWRDVMDLRLALELGAVTLACSRITSSQLILLDSLVEEMAAYERFEDYRRADVRFHVTLAEAAGSARLLSAMTAVQAEGTAIILGVAHPPTVLEHANDEHRALVGALRKGQVEVATRIVRRHCEGTQHIIAALQVGDDGPS